MLESIPSAEMSESIAVERVAPSPGYLVQVFVDSWSVVLVQGDHQGKHTTINNELAEKILGCIKVGFNNGLENDFVGSIIGRKLQ